MNGEFQNNHSLFKNIISPVESESRDLKQKHFQVARLENL